MIDETAEETAALYVLGILEDEEARRFAASLRENRELAALVAELEAALVRVAREVPQQALPPELKRRVLAAIRSDAIASVPAAPSRRASREWLAWAAAAALLFGCAALLAERSRLQREVAGLRQRDALARLEIVRLRSQLADAPGAAAVAVWDGERQRGVLELAQLPRLGAEQDYQLWLIDPAYADPVSGGVLRLTGDGHSRVSFSPAQPIRALAKLAVSRERQGGVEKAQGPLVLLSE